MTELDIFRNAVEAFISENEWTPSRFGKMAAGDPLFVFQLRDGREPRTATRQRVLSFIKQERASKVAAA